MAYDFVPMRVIVKGEELKELGLLPDSNFVKINGKDCPLGHCFTLELPLGECEVVVQTPPPNTIHQASTVTKENQLYYLTLTVDGSRNIVDASFGVEDITEDPWGLYANDIKKAIENREKILEWRRNHNPAPVQTPSAPVKSSPRSGGKAIGWGLVIMLIGILGVILCYTGEIEIETTAITDEFALSNLVAYYGIAAVGLLTFIVGLLVRKADS